LNGDIEINKEKIVVLGRGLAGLTTVILIARAGMSVTIIERSTEIGGRARTSVSDGFYLNQGPHAIYAAGPGVKILKELDNLYNRINPDCGSVYFFASLLCILLLMQSSHI
jgi:phytoene dehydrogenase-like protein